MGVDPATLGAEAQNIWSMLNDMSQNDPKAYREFIVNQMNEQKAMTNDRKKFTPTPGFVVKYRVHQSGKEQKLFINCCAHECVAIPKNPNNGKDVPRDTRSVPYTNNLEIPLAIGELRHLTIHDEPSIVVDAVFHPWVIERANWDSKFKMDAMQLASTWVEEEKKLKLIPPGKLIKSLYKGGNGSYGTNIITHDFIVPDEGSSLEEDNNASPKRRAEATQADKQLEAARPQPKVVLQTPKEVLQNRPSNQDPVEDSSTFELKLPSDAGRASKPRIEMIEEVKPTPTRKKSSAKSASVVKKGFLNKPSKNVAPLYPNGSTEGRPASAYVNLLHRSKVVDMTNMPSETTKPSTKSTPAKSKSSDGAEVFDMEFDQLCMEAEPDLDNHHKGTETDPFLNDQLAELLLGKM
ncbi:hypothetical protein AeMF1_009407 [Aphanomyces euteiches]|nr:hypothetical protein AeMF1_009407 [Aphanomyces euteiches]KAH9197727.1 hypothetical protein AeNC1_000311 [Aphanomyces euteiches]